MESAMVGGSFDPIHRGHIHLIHTVAARTPFRRFILVPVNQNHFKPGAQPAAAAHRLAMAKLAVSEYPALYPADPSLEFIIDDCEITRPGPSYTYDTVKELYLKYSIKGRLGLLLGDDLLSHLKEWYHYPELKELVRFIVIRREDSVIEFNDLAADLFYLDNPTVEESSTNIRNALGKLKTGQVLEPALEKLMTPRVAQYVYEHRLYRA